MAHFNILKGQNVNLLIKNGSNYEVIAASKSCDFSLTANTADAAAKDDANPMWDNPEFTYYDWSASNESFIVDITKLKYLVKQAAGMNTDKTIYVQFQVGTDSSNAPVCKCGEAVITSLEIDAPAEDYASLNISFEGAGQLENGTFKTISTVSDVRNKIRGKQLMIAIEKTTGSGESATTAYQTICAATSHKLSISAQTADVRTKDENDMAICKEVTGYSLSLSTENLVNICGRPSPVCADEVDLMNNLMSGTICKLKFGYYANAKGNKVSSTGSWGAPDESNGIVISGNFVASSLSISGANKDNASFSAEFACKGVPTIA